MKGDWGETKPEQWSECQGQCEREVVEACGRGRGTKEKRGPNERNKRMVSVTGLLPGGQRTERCTASSDGESEEREVGTTGPLRGFRSRPMVHFPH